MNASALVQELEQVGPQQYVSDIRGEGRSALDPAIRRHMAQMYVRLRALSRSESSTEAWQLLARNVGPIFESEWKIADANPPLIDELPRATDIGGLRYQPYTNVRILNVYLGTNSDTTTEHAVAAACWRAIHYLSTSWLNYEYRTRLGTEQWNQLHIVSDEVLTRRIEIVSQVLEDAALETGYDRPRLPPLPESWADLAVDSQHQAYLEYFTALTQTTYHDEVTFLRTIHLTEACLWGALMCVISYIQHIEAKRYHDSIPCLEEARRFAVVQTLVFEAMKTMPPEHFADFRDATENASAVQSLSNQLLYIHLYGLLDRKVEMIRTTPELQHLLHYADDDFVTLRKVNASLDFDDPITQEIAVALSGLDKEMQKWRGKHLGVAINYLPPAAPGTGGTEGANYLRQFVRDRFALDSGHVVTAPPQDPAGIQARPVLCSEN